MDTNQRSPLALRLLLIAVVLGVFGDLFLQIRPWGVGVLLFASVLFAACVLTRKLGGPALSKSTTWLAIATIPLAALFAWRDADGLRALNGLLLFLCVGMVALRASLGAVYATSLGDLLWKGPLQWLVFLGEGSKLAASDVKWKGTFERKGLAQYAAVGRGLMLAVLPVGLFIVLLSNADAVFQHVITPNIAVDPEDAMTHFFIWGMATVLSAGFLRRLFLAGTDPVKPPVVLNPAIPAPPPTKYGITEIATVLISLNVVVGLFVAIQFRYLFGGTELVLATTGLSYAEYARKGFFELLTVVALSVPILMAMNGLLKRERLRDQKVFRCMAGLFIIQIFVVAASALDRMKLYVDFYSLSPLRLYAVAGMVFMMGVLALFLGTILRGRADRFAFGSLAWLATVVIGLNVINPDAMIARYNLLDRPGQRVDANLLASLSSDATPALLEGVARLKGEKAQVIREALNDRYRQARPWTSSNLAYREGREEWAARQSVGAATN